MVLLIHEPANDSVLLVIAVRARFMDPVKRIATFSDPDQLGPHSATNERQPFKWRTLLDPTSPLLHIGFKPVRLTF